VRDQLQAMSPLPHLRGLREEGLAQARRLLDAAEALRRTGRPLPPASQAQLLAGARQLKAHEEDLRR